VKLAQIETVEGLKVSLLLSDRVVTLSALVEANDYRLTPSWLTENIKVLDIIGQGDQALADLTHLIEGAASVFRVDNKFGAPLESVSFLPPIYPSKIVAIGRNYVDHAIEGGAEPPAAPLIFNKLPNSLSSHNAPIVLHGITSQVDYEAELAVVIGRRATRVSESEALDYVFGYTPVNDVSARDLQFGDGQWVRGKSLDSFAPLGPFITTRDEIPNVQELKIEGRLNGKVMQSSNTAKMIFGVAYLVSYISQAITLEPGDVIATGTPDGVGIFRKPPVLLKAGDVYEVEIEGLVPLRNPVVEP
jgi:2-keto-4-pentenoate hydratase/2-oxohepta-3-ene-1,7-dioic acid hydratase in catechol pathway